jgi:hypothetical protein
MFFQRSAKLSAKTHSFSRKSQGFQKSANTEKLRFFFFQKAKTFEESQGF